MSPQKKRSKDATSIDHVYSKPGLELERSLHWHQSKECICFFGKTPQHKTEMLASSLIPVHCGNQLNHGTKKHRFEGIYPERWQLFVHAYIIFPDFISLPDVNIQSHTIHVRNIYLHLVDFYMAFM